MEMTIKRYGHVNIDEQRPAVDLLDAAFPSTPGTEQRCLDRRARRDSNPNLLIRSPIGAGHARLSWSPPAVFLLLGAASSRLKPSRLLHGAATRRLPVHLLRAASLTPS